ncbi:cutinase family protein [Nocardia sp. SYP-A9097]|uniref:cutinase family protein n=1 Tax=Nocardia sp. SYP-A9097 TaxID=2663237 RepID=UPI00129B33C0|nr:cutinase family protein [Nocardia sp. SYP-A9097]MRH91739.1 cutinase family protein [Nocardia sp. SYP-A9097]
MRRATALFAAFLLAILFSISYVASPAAKADDCLGDWAIGIGGLGDNSSSIFAPFVNQPVGYNSADPMSGLNELDRLFWSHRNQCPGDHIRVIGHSEGAGIVHAWVTAHQGVDNANAILLSDPKRAPGPGWGGLSSTPGSGIVGYPLAGVDDWFGGFPVLTVCNRDDQICDTSAGWWGYLFGGAHSRYDFNVWDYGDWDSGVWYR